MKKKIYLDYAATTPVDSKVLKAMMPYLKDKYGNPSSIHSFGQEARVAIDRAREQAAKFLNCHPLEIVFTGSASESDNLAIKGLIKEGEPPLVGVRDCHEVDNPFDYNMGARAQWDICVEHYESNR